MRWRSACHAIGSKYCLRANGHHPVSVVRIFFSMSPDEISSLPEISTSLTTGESFFCCDAHPKSDATDMTKIGALLQSPISAESGHAGLDRKIGGRLVRPWNRAGVRGAAGAGRASVESRGCAPRVAPRAD